MYSLVIFIKSEPRSCAIEKPFKSHCHDTSTAEVGAVAVGEHARVRKGEACRLKTTCRIISSPVTAARGPRMAACRSISAGTTTTRCSLAVP